MRFHKQYFILVLALSILLTACADKAGNKEKQDISTQGSAQTDVKAEVEQVVEEEKSKEEPKKKEKVKDKVKNKIKSKEAQAHQGADNNGESSQSEEKKSKADNKTKKVKKTEAADPSRKLVSWHKHGSHWHLIYSDGSEEISDTEPKVKQDKVAKTKQVNSQSTANIKKLSKTEEVPARALVSWHQHDDHWHLLYSDGTEEVSYTDPATWVAKEKPAETNTQAEQDKTAKEAPADKKQSAETTIADDKVPAAPAKTVVSWYKHGDHWHIKYSDGTEVISYTDPGLPEDKKTPIADNRDDNRGSDNGDNGRENDDNRNPGNDNSNPGDQTVPAPTKIGPFDKVVDHGDHIHVWVNGVEYVISRLLYEEFIQENKFDEVKARGLTGLQYHEIKDKTLREEVEYISKIYRVKLEAIRVSENYFSFNDPAHEYDPTHIHPFFVSRKLFYIPEVTGNPEVDFENELISVSHHTGIPVFALEVRDGRFVLPHDSHEHYVYIQSNGYEEFVKNKKPTLTGEYVEGPLDEEEVLRQVVELKKLVEEKYTVRVEMRRVMRVLEEFEFRFHRLKSNSTVGYTNMLNHFKDLYLSDKPAEEEPVVEPTDPEAEKLYSDLMNMMLTKSPKFFEKLGVDREQFIREINENVKDRAKLYELSYKLKEYDRFDGRIQIVGVGYMDYFMEMIDKPHVMPSVRNDIAEVLIKIVKTGYFRVRGNVKELIDVNIKLSKNSLMTKEYQIKDMEKYPFYYSYKTTYEQRYRAFVNEMRYLSFPIELPDAEKLPKDLPVDEIPDEETPEDPGNDEGDTPKEPTPDEPAPKESKSTNAEEGMPEQPEINQ